MSKRQDRIEIQKKENESKGYDSKKRKAYMRLRI